MFGKEMVQNMDFVMIPPQDIDDAAVDSAWVDMKNYGHAVVIISVGDTSGAAFAVTFNEASDTSGTGEQVLAYTRAWSSGQKLLIDTVVGTPVVGETITSTLTAEINEIGKDYLIVRNLTGGTTWTDNAAITFGNSGATAVMNGTGEQEDILVPLYTAPSSTVTIPAVTFKNYLFEIDADSLSTGYSCIQVALSDPTAATIAGGIIILSDARYRGMPMPGVMGTQKMAATFA